MFSNIIGRGGKFLLDQIVRVLTHFKINPNILTFTGVLISFWAAFEFGYGNFFRGGIVIIACQRQASAWIPPIRSRMFFYEFPEVGPILIPGKMPDGGSFYTLI